MSTPTFSLPACPRCSSIEGGLCQPFWKFAHNTSRARGRKCYFWVAGCAHAKPVACESLIYDDAAEWNRVEQAWLAAANGHFAAMTACWTPAQRDSFNRRLRGLFSLPGATDALPILENLPPEPSGSTKPQTNENHHGQER